PPHLHHPFPTRRSSDLGRIDAFVEMLDRQARRPGDTQTEADEKDRRDQTALERARTKIAWALGAVGRLGCHFRLRGRFTWNGFLDRKSTRLNSSHVAIS